METLESIALSRMATMTRQIDIIANNIANANTTGYKTARMFFSEFLQQAGDEQLSYVYGYGTIRDFSPGAIEFTDNPLDVAIDGDGFFAVDVGDGMRYTRNGHFRIDEQRKLIVTQDDSLIEETERLLVTSEGYAVMSDQNTPVTIPATGELDITPEGELRIGDKVVARLSVVTFDQPHLLTQNEAGVFQTDQTAVPLGQPKLIQGAIESSNVSPIIEITQMIEVMRSFQTSQQLIKGDDEAKRRAIQTIAGVSA
ncbi:MAG: flagellar hook-basal body complex protein [Alphaproteobacteria bacterium]